MKRTSRTRPRRSHAAAFTLMELMVVVSIVSVVMTLSATLFVALSRAERNAMRSVAAQQTLARLNEQFRRDVHRSTSASLSADDQPNPTLTLMSAGEPIRYQISSGVLERIAGANGTPHHEAYRLPEAEWKFEFPDDKHGVRLVLHRAADTVTRTAPELLPIQEWRIEAVLNLTPMPVAAKGVAP